MSSSPTDLLQRIAAGDRGAFRELYVGMGPQVKGYLTRACGEAGRAEELTQEVMLVVWRNASQFDPARARGETWIYTIARNRVIDDARRQRVVSASERDPHFVAEPLPAADDALIDEERARWVEEAVEHLATSQRAVVVQAYYESRSYPEIAEEQRVALGTVKSRARLALARLRSLLGSEDGA